ncbi:tRNA (guanosine(37)-N1)-methyltransferase TrmD [Francisella adeliensis]|uniref:tRNA (guanine-N(1)-)-methyltransferase n=1 Tax=Francisella adeliensis TaxID=2007306 RepID=A0A2Z4XWM6_9GAMM|nr:tRNA (guanosine(37)-N1)-methyltransferase TrmD [Francisella adeliensis]AXA33274.1 tRNA (guanosine(37)-N1)-methyltransferase TrmD [Francisella adeliensis]MBK2084998.1 tRNA (guanosine(37)-N1)-methyltransferase TrmD [Francisella adeliensis]MBK2097011.1 tRNA (guanosine(37)-N1)-methyltransferase TrmD [Francisella adeliensis]QIW11503.1 tRNA (guanosine(37)-N1)-methyltransferase TrmD [Francisella adeliensis]QIW13378.1 tRNA (guanosine(37)-N1)-methyltransferase TrmD [Francisella adeliensis]
MKFGIVSIFPEMFKALGDFGITSRAFKRSKVSMSFFNPRSYTADKHSTVDDTSFGGGAGMVMKYQPLADAITDAKNTLGCDTKVVYLSPQGSVFNHAKALELLKNDSLILLCGRYEGVDERLIEDYIDEEISVGDFVLSGGEFPAMLVMDSLIRLLPDVLGNKDSLIEDSFYDGLLDYPHYTKPAVLPNGKSVPEVLLSGNHKNIAKWRRKQKLIRTYERRKDLMKCLCLSPEDKQLLEDNNKDKVSTKGAKK